MADISQEHVVHQIILLDMYYLCRLIYGQLLKYDKMLSKCKYLETKENIFFHNIFQNAQAFSISVDHTQQQYLFFRDKCRAQKRPFSAIFVLDTQLSVWHSIAYIQQFYI